MKNDVSIGKLRGIPLALLVSLVLQVGVAVWWVSAKARDNYFLEQRVDQLETVVSRSRENTNQIYERLVRIEERVKAQTVLLNRIDKRVSVIGR